MPRRSFKKIFPIKKPDEASATGAKAKPLPKSKLTWCTILAIQVTYPKGCPTSLSIGSPNESEYWLAQRPRVLARPTSFDGSPNVEASIPSAPHSCPA